MAAAARLDRGFLIRREHVLVVAQQLALEAALVQIQNTVGLGREVRGPREDPRVVPPRLDGILGQPAAQRRGRDLWVPVIRSKSCGLRILMDQPTESISSHDPPSRHGDS